MADLTDESDPFSYMVPLNSSNIAVVIRRATPLNASSPPGSLPFTKNPVVVSLKGFYLNYNDFRADLQNKILLALRASKDMIVADLAPGANIYSVTSVLIGNIWAVWEPKEPATLVTENCMDACLELLKKSTGVAHLKVVYAVTCSHNGTIGIVVRQPQL